MEELCEVIEGFCKKNEIGEAFSGIGDFGNYIGLEELPLNHLKL